MAEWSIAAVLKTVEPRGSGGSNPSLSAKKVTMKIVTFFYAQVCARELNLVFTSAPFLVYTAESFSVYSNTAYLVFSNKKLYS